MGKPSGDLAQPGRGRGSFVAPGPPGHAGHFRSLPRASEAAAPGQKAPPRTAHSGSPTFQCGQPGWAPHTNCPGSDADGGQGWGMLGQGPAGVTTGTTVCFFSKSALCGNYILKNSISKFPYLCQLILMEKESNEDALIFLKDRKRKLEGLIKTQVPIRY